MNVVITGANGYIGSNLSQRLVNDGHTLTLSDIQFRETDNYLRADIRHYEEAEKLFLDGNVDCVIHLAGEVGRLNGEEHPGLMIEVNELGTLNLIRLCQRHNVPLLYTSTSEVYGPQKGRLVEETTPEHDPHLTIPTNIYALSKLHGEHLVKHYVHNYGLKATIVRPFMVYGPREPISRFRSAMLNFIIRLLEKKTIDVHKDTVRSWTYITDIVHGLCLVLAKSTFETCPTFNLGRDEPHTMLEVAQLISKECGSDPSLIHLVEPPRHFITYEKYGDFTRAKQLLGFEAKVSLAEGIKRTVDWAREVTK